MKKFRILLLLAAVMLEVGCGLPDSYLLYPPARLTQASPTLATFAFTNPVHDANHDINVNFTGDELYYKLYSDSSQITGSDYVQSDPADPSAQLTAKGFFPVCLATDTVGTRTDPVIAIDSGTAAAGSTVTVTLNGGGTVTSYVLNSNPSIEIRRDTPNSVFPTTYKTFQENSLGPGTGNGFVPGDVDFNSISGNTFSGLVYIAWYAVSFGYTNTSTPSRSTALYLGYSAVSYP